MAKDAYYFSHDSNARTDTKIVDMMYDYGMAGYGMFWFIVEVMRESDCYKLENNRSTWRALGMQMHLKADEVQKFIDDCIEQYRLFEGDGVYFWSNSLVKRMKKLEETRAKRKAAAEKRWSNNANANKKNANALQEDSKSIADEVQEDCNFMQSKVKESKEKNSKENIIYMDLSIIDDCISNVKITEMQYQKLKEKYPLKLVNEKIIALDVYKDVNKYKEHYKVLNIWCKKEEDNPKYKEQPQKKRPKKDIYARLKED